MFVQTSFIPKRVAEAFGPHENSHETILISLNSPVDTTPGSSHPKLNEAAWADILRLEFHDADQDGRSGDARMSDVVDRGHLQLFTQEQALQIFKFLRDHQDTKQYVIVHCEGGISRSAAVAKFIAAIYGLPFNDSYSLYNRHVFTTLLRLHGECLHTGSPVPPEALPGLT